ncbi:MAG: hypothetical protein RAO92_01980 [Candidatus Euphemobacter frigidus]|nr:hypothetical protein [Candidatus Euphemobacter frigidus]MDP8275151.1 hypothetical protein [Candidatus Euphemobacter frigidus]
MAFIDKRVPLIKPVSSVDQALNETEELIKIFFASIKTVQRKQAIRKN